MSDTDTLTADDIANHATSIELAAALLAATETLMLGRITARGHDETATAIIAAAFAHAIGKINNVADPEFKAIVIDLLIYGPPAGDIPATYGPWPKLHS